MTSPEAPGPARRGSQDRDRALSRVTTATVAGGAGAVLATGALALWLSTPAHAHPSSHVSTSSSTGSSTSSQTKTGDDGGLQPPARAPSGGQTDGGSQQPAVISGGS